MNNRFIFFTTIIFLVHSCPAVKEKNPTPGSDCRPLPPRTRVESTPARLPVRWCTGSRGRPTSSNLETPSLLANWNRKWPREQSADCHLIVSSHQLLDSLSVDGGDVLDVGAFLLARDTVSETLTETHSKVTRARVSGQKINPTWSGTACSWATMMCSCPRACRRSGRRVVWCDWRAAAAHQRAHTRITWQTFVTAVIDCVQTENISYTAEWPAPPRHCSPRGPAEEWRPGSCDLDGPGCGDAPCGT